MMQSIEDGKRRDFAWGQHDCCVFAARVADAMTDGDYVRRLLRQFDYNSQADIDALFSANGGLRGLMTDFMGEPVGWMQSAQGDVVLMLDAEDKEVLGVCEGSAVICATAKGVIPLPMSRAVCAWKIY